MVDLSIAMLVYQRVVFVILFKGLHEKIHPFFR